MTRTKLLVCATAAAATMALTACSGSEDTATAPATSAGASPESGASPEEGAPSAADVMFVRMMIPHHQQAIEMSDLILDKSDIPADVTALAETIRAEQGPEIEQMETWLEQWDRPAGPRDGHGGHGGGEMGMGTGMPMSGDVPMMGGMLSAEDIRKLADAEGTDAVRLYLEQMIAHHEGAIDMARAEVADGSYQPTVDLARSIIDTQQREITTMRDMLSAM